MMDLENRDYTYIVAGDEMERLMRERYPDRKIIPFREDLSKGRYCGFSVDRAFITQRASFWQVSEAEYLEKLKPIIELDATAQIMLCFGEDECCRANLEFMTGFLKAKGYSRPLRVNIVDEYNLDLLKDYIIQLL